MKARINTGLIVLLSVVSALLFFLPFASVFLVQGEHTRGEWESLYLYEDGFTILYYLPFVLLWIIYLIRPVIIKSIGFKILLTAAALITFMMSNSSANMLAQDYQPDLGTYCSLSIFPLFVLFLLFQILLAKRK